MHLNKNIDKSHIHLLSPNAFKNRAPNHLVAEHLNWRTQDLSMKDAATYHLQFENNNDFKGHFDKKLKGDLVEIEDYYKEKGGIQERDKFDNLKTKMVRTVIVQNSRSVSIPGNLIKIDKESKKEHLIEIVSMPYDVDMV